MALVGARARSPREPRQPPGSPRFAGARPYVTPVCFVASLSFGASSRRPVGTCPWATSGPGPLRVEASGANLKRSPASGRAADGAAVHPAMQRRSSLSARADYTRAWEPADPRRVDQRAHLRAHARHVCTGTGLTPATSASGP
jgi:hypothetical protein